MKNGVTPVKAACGITGVKFDFLMKKAPRIIKTIKVIIFAAADQITASNLDYTIIRPAWLTNKNEINYEKTVGATTPFRGTEVSRLSVADYIADLIENPTKDVKANVGLDKAGTDGDKPAWY